VSIGCKVGGATLGRPCRQGVLLVVHESAIESRHGDGSSSIDFVDQQCKCIEDEMIQLHVVPPGLHDLAHIPFLHAKQAPDDETVVAVNGLCIGGGTSDRLICAKAKHIPNLSSFVGSMHSSVLR